MAFGILALMVSDIPAEGTVITAAGRLQLALGLPRIVASSLSALSQNRCFVSAMLMLLLLDGGKPAMAQAAPGIEASGQSLDVQMRNVMYHFTDDVSVHIRKLHGKLAPKGHNLPIFDDAGLWAACIHARLQQAPAHQVRQGLAGENGEVAQRIPEGGLSGIGECIYGG